jgi:hypothetical protein
MKSNVKNVQPYLVVCLLKPLQNATLPATTKGDTVMVDRISNGQYTKLKRVPVVQKTVNNARIKQHKLFITEASS